MESTVTRYARVRAILTDPAYPVPAVPAGVPPAGVAWLRAHVARFSSGAEHARRRTAALAELSRLDPPALRRAAHDRAAATDPAEAPWAVPISLLAAALGARDPQAAVPLVRAVAPSYQPHTEITPAADDAVARLVAAFGGTPDEPTAARIGLLVQACDATAALIRTAVGHAAAGTQAVLTEILRHDPPVRATRRVRPDGTPTVLDIAAANRDPAAFADPDRFDPRRPDAARHLTFGAGAHACPGAAVALALAAGVLDALSR